jgi:hypothetical protein
MTLMHHFMINLIEPRSENKHELALKTLNEMGFMENNVNISLLDKYNGVLMDVVQELLNREANK